MNDKKIEIIVAVDEDGGFGKEGNIPWHFKEDFKRFQKITKGNICVMGRRTYTDMLEMRRKRDGKNPKPIRSILPNRESYVLTSDPKFTAPGATVASTLADVIHKLPLDEQRIIFILGGERLYREALTWADTIHMTVVPGQYGCDKFFPVQVLNKKFKIETGERHEPDNLYFVTYQRKKE